MLFNFKTIALLLLTIGVVQAELTPCIQKCSQKAATDNGCGSFANLKCVCKSKGFQNEAMKCIQDTKPGNANGCTKDDLAKAEALQQQNCKNFAHFVLCSYFAGAELLNL
ncbi:hypothetical protein NP233_g9619 [Leucocoprinus birnbaumii]|uniref:CFEM domain-containing protein n=1 Tax=Leucocoprinus birnbaumii TaxID=56174 RepID=A0AAD5VNL5_9AGAR|nr:hypothetical protein NP233_g9619 [Leucocoprinus birnbaumii]